MPFISCSSWYISVFNNFTDMWTSVGKVSSYSTKNIVILILKVPWIYEVNQMLISNVLCVVDPR